MNTVTTRRKAERFARAIDLDVPPLFLDGGDPSMRPAVTLTAALRSAAATSAPAPLSAAARLAMRERLVAAASAPVESSPNSPSVSSRVTGAASRTKDTGRRIGRRTSALIGSVVIVTSVSGVGVAAARSLPGSPFYDLKQATESVQLWLASGPHAKGERHLAFARTRLAEARALGPDSSHLASTLRSMNAETRQGSSDLIAAYRSSGETDPLGDLVTFTRQQFADLARFGDSAGDQVRAQTVYSMTLLAGVAQQVESVAGTTCLTCLVNGTKPHTTPAPGNGRTSPTPTPTTSGSTPASTPPPTSSASARPDPKPTDLLPTGLLPSGLLPTKLPTKLPTLPPLLQRHDGKAGKSGILPTLSPIPLISTLTQLLGGK
jgi:hypothetical protein